MKEHEYLQNDATALAALVQKGHVTAAELLQLAIDRAQKVNPRINAIVQPLYQKGFDMIEQIPKNAPLAGVPFLLKDLELEWAGTPLRSGCRGFNNYVSQQDSELVARFKAAGLVLFGKTNTPEFGLTPYTESELFGPARNPWNLAHSSGGSSGGSAAAVAAGIVPMASASDGGGSIRIPASCCGLFGIKTSRGRTPMGPRYGEGWSGAVVSFALSRSVRDSAALLDAVHGETPNAPYLIEKPTRPYLQELQRTPGKLRVAMCTEHAFAGQKTDDQCVQATRQTAQLLENLGHSVEEIALPYSAEVFTKTFVTMVVGETAAGLRSLGDFLGRKATKADVELNTWFLAKLGEAYSAADYAYEKNNWNVLTRKMGDLHQKYDVLLTPTMARPPLKIGELQNSTAENAQIKLVDTLGLYGLVRGGKAIDQLAEKAFGYIPFTPIQNMTGQPSMSVPLVWGENNLPIGTMFTAKFGAEDLLFRLAAQLEAAKPWFNKMPDL